MRPDGIVNLFVTSSMCMYGRGVSNLASNQNIESRNPDSKKLSPSLHAYATTMLKRSPRKRT